MLSRIVTIALLLTLTMPISIDMSPTIYVKQRDFRARLTSINGYGRIKYHVDGLPHGIKVQNDILVVYGNKVNAGYYPVKVIAEDEQKSKDERIIVLVVPQTVTVVSAPTGRSVVSSASSISSSAGFQSSSTVSSSSSSSSTVVISGSSSNSNDLSLSAQASISPSGNLDDLISRYGGDSVTSDRTSTSESTTVTSTETFPKVNFSTARDPNAAPNTVPQIIRTSQATVTSADFNTITDDDIRKKAVLERSITASKAVANLLSIIEQAKANRNRALTEIEIFKAQYNQAVQNQRNAQTEIIAGENSAKNLKVAISGAQTSIKDYENKIDKLENKRRVLLSAIRTHQNTIDQARASLAKLATELDNSKSGLKMLQISLVKANNQKTVLTDSLKSINDDLNEYKTKFATIPQRKFNSKNKIDRLHQRIRELEIELSLTKNRLAHEKDELKTILELEANSIPILNKLNTQADRLTTDLQNTESTISTISTKVKTLKESVIPGIEAQIGKLNKTIKDSEQQIKILSITIINEIKNPIRTANAKVQKAISDLVFLKSQVSTFEEKLRQLYIIGNDANTKVINAKENLEAIITREAKEKKDLDTATVNLEKARAEKELADLAVQEIIAHRTDALPYAIVPNGKGLTNAGTPNGNNPSGSPLGPVQHTGGYNRKYNVQSWTHYLSEAYGAGVNPAYSGSVTALYPFKLSDNIRPVFNNSDFPCGGKSGNMSSQDGTIVNYSNSLIVAQDSQGNRHSVEVAPCTIMIANQQRYKPAPGDVIVWKGYSTNNRVWKSQQITCLSK